MWGDYKRFSDEYWINEDDDKEPDSDDDCDCDLELLRPPAVTTLGLLSQATRTEGVNSTCQCDTLKIGIAFSADGSNCLLRLIARQFRGRYKLHKPIVEICQPRRDGYIRRRVVDLSDTIVTATHRPTSKTLAPDVPSHPASFEPVLQPNMSHEFYAMKGML
ncbi:hypothetical protein CAPTEDRAFT_205305 [Capitella teleta]|uniref:Uncharacterized protein n=1 Tax=Capitella teleta TaxID=283909 RepID=R7TLQ1_CAPTE|nr:hypothetical protein CAPTEDRAFT_205305 [Capitella teleta]|eukprot:ELT94753.1 hypothetical protein CAPTEDRAFT_205305 [Capitella teleta]